MMSIRLVELHRVLKPTGSIYLHCDPTAGPYLRVIMDAVFGPKCLVNEVTWRRYGAHNDVGQGSRHFGRVHDLILFYAMATGSTWTQLFKPLEEKYVEETYRYVEAETGRRFMTTPLTGPGGAEKGNPVFEWRGHTRAWRYSEETMERLDREGRLYYSKTGYARQKHYLDDSPGVPIQDVWDDIYSLSGAHAERLGYPTQKPLALLERIISASSNPGDVVLDPFCGCGTAVHAAQKLDRKWIGIDITNLAIGLVRRRMQDAFPGIEIKVIGEPVDAAGAKELAATRPSQFEYWVLDRIDAQPTGGKGPDLDGVLPFIEFGGKAKRVVVSVKGTKVVNPEMLRELRGAMNDDKPIGVLITLLPPTPGMKTQAAAAGFYESAGRKYPKVQILTAAEILKGKRPQMPPKTSPFAEARVEREKPKQPKML